MPQCYRCLWTIILAILGLHLSDCNAFDHCNDWIFDAAIDVAKTYWRNFRSLGSSPKGAWRHESSRLKDIKLHAYAN